MTYTLPTSVEVGGVEYEIRSDYRAALDIIAALSDFELNDQERVIVALDIFYPDFEKIPYGGFGMCLSANLWDLFQALHLRLRAEQLQSR